MITATAVPSPGLVTLSGFRAEGTGPGEDLHLLTIHWAAPAEGTVYLDPLINSLSNSGYVIMNVEVAGCQVNVLPRTRIKGDVNEDGAVDIIDALLVARSSASSPPC